MGIIAPRGRGPNAPRASPPAEWRTTIWPQLQPSVANSPPPMPHDLGIRANCIACHSGPAAVEEIRTTHPERVNCRQCHVTIDPEARGFTVPVNVDAIAFWIVRDAERAALEVQDYDEAVILSAQTALRDAIGKHDLAELIQSRVELGHGLKVALEQKMATWGIEVQSVEIRDVIIPAALEDAMSRQAQAERERQARIILGTAETEIAHKFVEAAAAYRDHPAAMNLRAMNMLYESIVKRAR